MFIKDSTHTSPGLNQMLWCRETGLALLCCGGITWPQWDILFIRIKYTIYCHCSASYDASVLSPQHQSCWCCVLPNCKKVCLNDKTIFLCDSILTLFCIKRKIPECTCLQIILAESCRKEEKTFQLNIKDSFWESHYLQSVTKLQQSWDKIHNLFRCSSQVHWWLSLSPSLI